MGVEFLKNSKNKIIQINVSHIGELVLPLATFMSPIPRFAQDNFGDVYLRSVNGIPLLSLMFDQSQFFESHIFMGKMEKFLAISLRKRTDLRFISKPYEIIAAIRELDFRTVN